MARRKRNRERRQSTARSRAERHTSGFETSYLKVPEGLGFFNLKPGNYNLSILCYLTGEGNPEVDGEAGLEHWERTFFIYRNIGVEEKSYLCASKTLGKSDYIQELRARMSRQGASRQELRPLDPKERQIFLVFDHDKPNEGIQLLECSHHIFGKRLDSRIKNSKESIGWDLFYFNDEDGMILGLTVEESKADFGKFTEVTAIDFFPREDPLPDEVVNHEYCLDDMLLETPYEKLKEIYLLGVGEDEPEEEAPTPRRRKSRPSREPEDEAPDPAKRPKRKPKNPQKTAEDLGLEKNMDVEYEGGVYTIFRISKDGLTLVLIDEEDEMKKGIPVEDVELVEEEEENPKPKKKASPKKKATAKKKPKEEPLAEDEDGDLDEDWDEDWDED